MKKKKVIKRLIIALCILIIPVSILIMASIRAKKIANNPNVIEYFKHGNISMPRVAPQDSLLFNFEKMRPSIPFYLRTSDLRNDLREVGVYDNMGIIRYTSVNVKEGFSLDDIVFSPQKAIPKIEGHWVTSIATQLRQKRPVDSVIFNYVENPQIRMREFRRSDNFRSYSIHTKTLSIKYGENEPSDITIGQYVSKFSPVSFAFLKKDSLLFFIVYGPNTEKIPVEEALNNDYLGEFIKWQND